MSREDIEQLVDRMLLTLKYAEEQEWKVLAEYIEDLQQENNQLKDRINKAVEFVEEFIREDYYEKLDEYITHFTWNKTKDDLIHLLKGDKE